MRDFFHGWRRKAGCVALMVACVVMGVWMRSLVVRDVLHEDSTSRCFRSYSGTIGFQQFLPYRKSKFEDEGWLWHSYSGQSFVQTGPSGWGIGAIKNYWATFDHYTNEAIDWHWKWAGFEFGAIALDFDRANNPTLHIWTVPYWSIVTPLTLLSAYLILWKRRPRAIASSSN